MPVLQTTGAYNTCEDVLNALRVIVNDSEVAGGDVLTDTAPFTFTLLNLAFRRVQIELAIVGVETQMTTAWLIGLPTIPTVDPEARMIVNDSGTQIVYPNGVGNAVFNLPFLFTDLVLPVRLWERQTGTANFVSKMAQPNTGLLNMVQQSFLVDWMWQNDGLVFRGALQSEDVKVEYEKALQPLAAPSDPVPIRGVVNAAAYYAALIFIGSRGGAILPEFKAEADAEIQLIKQLSTRRRQHKQVRRRPYSGRGGRQQYPTL